MKIEAYKVDCCGRICVFEDCLGILESQDMFEPFRSFPSCPPDKAKIHFCMDCYNVRVTIPISHIDRAKNEDEYQNKMKELTYILRKSVVYQYNKKQMTNLLKNKRK